MVVQHPQAWPMIDEYGIDIHPGMYTAAAISEVIALSCNLFCNLQHQLRKTLQTLSINHFFYPVKNGASTESLQSKLR